jgi:trans-aconitate methyltransferase
MSEFIGTNEYFAAFDARTERESYRLRSLARIMTDVPSQGERLTASMQSALGLFTVINPDEADHPSHRERRATARENAYERESQAEAEKLRVLPKRKLKASCYSHVRELRPVPADLVRWARELGIGLA